MILSIYHNFTIKFLENKIKLRKIVHSFCAQEVYNRHCARGILRENLLFGRGDDTCKTKIKEHFMEGELIEKNIVCSGTYRRCSGTVLPECLCR